MGTSKAKKGTKKSSAVKRGKTLQSVKPLSKPAISLADASPKETVTFEYGGLQVRYEPQKG